MRHAGGSFDQWLDRVHPEDRERVSRDMGAFFSSSATRTRVEYRLRRSGGEYVPVHEFLVVERGGDGSPIRLVSMVEERIPPEPEDPAVRYQKLFQELGDAVFVVDAQGRLQNFNPAFLELLGLTAEDARSRSPADHFRDPDVRAAVVRELRREGRVSGREVEILASEGSPRTVLCSAVAIRDADGAYAGYTAVLHDITETRRTEDERRRTERSRADDERTRADDEHARTEDELRRRTAGLERQVAVLRTRSAIAGRLARAVRLDRGTLEDVVALLPEGFRFPDRVGIRLVVGPAEASSAGFDPAGAWCRRFGRGDDGAATVAMAVSFRPPDSAQEGPNRPAAEEEELLEAVAERLSETARRIRVVEEEGPDRASHRTALERSHDLLAILDADGTIRFVGPSVDRLLGYDPDSLVGDDALDLIHPEDRDAAGEALAAAAADPDRAVTLEHRLRHADGTWRYFESTALGILEGPEVGGVVVDSRDVTERKGREEQLRHTQKMEAVGHLAGGVAHDLNNLLTVIRVSARLLEDHIEGPEPPEEIEDIEAAAAAAAVLARRLLAFSGRDIRNPRRLDLAVVVREMEAYLVRTAGEEVETVIDLPPGPLPIRADALQIEQVILNLFENALEAMPHGGRVVLEARAAEPGDLPAQIRHPGQWALLKVEDSGPGVPEEIRDTIFEPFFTTREHGTGLGLATVRTVVSRLGGVVEVGEAPGGGASFTVCFPRSEGEVALEAEPEGRPDFSKGRTILVVEGDAASRSLVDRLLSKAGYRVLEAHDGVSALTLLGAYGGELDLLLTEVEMPHVGGPALAARVQTTHPDARVLYLGGPDPDPDDLTTVRRDALSTDLLPAVEEVLGAEKASGKEPGKASGKASGKEPGE